MQTFWQAQDLENWLGAIKAGTLAAAPAEGVYGYVANPFDAAAVERIHAAKRRPANKGFIVLIQNVGQLDQLCGPLEDAHRAAIETYWQPGQPPTTLILPVKPNLQYLTGGLPTLAVRLPHAGYMQQYLAATGMPLVSTSLNISGQPPVLEGGHIPAQVMALALPQPLSGHPSRIFNPATGQWLR